MYVLYGQKLKLDEFFESIRDDLYRGRVKAVFDFSMNAVSILNLNFATSRRPFFIEVERLNVKNAQAIAMDSEPLDKIILSDALVEHCIGAVPVPVDDVFRGSPPEDFDYNLPAQSALAWALGHEATHLYRCHDQVEYMYKRSIKTSNLKQVLEMDADMLGVSCVYRMMKTKFHFYYSDDDIRKLTLYSIFWAMRTLYSAGGLETHLTIGPRIALVLEKIASMGADPFMPIRFQEKSEVDRRRNMLITCLRKFEKFFQQNVGDNVDIWSEIKIHQESGQRKVLQVLWGNVSKSVGKLSSAPAYIGSK